MVKKWLLATGVATMPTILKTVTYGFMHLIIAFFVAWFVSGDIMIAVGISLIEPFIQIAFFFMHEKVWDRFGGKTARDAWHVTKPPCCATTAAMIKQHLSSGACSTKGE
jgi:uncharacterized membrane protein